MVDPECRFDLDAILPLVYDELRSCASRALSNERSDHTLQSTELVHEAYVRLAGLKEIDWNDKRDILRAAVGVMRRVLIDHARSRNSQKRGGGNLMLSCADELVPAKDDEQETIDLIALDEALEKLGGIDQQKAEIVELRYFGGQTVDEIAGVIGISPATVKRHWTFTKAWLHRELAGDAFGG